MINVTKAEVEQFIDMPSVFDFDKRFGIFITQANRLDLKNFLGVDFYNDVIINLEAGVVPAQYTALQDGETYQNKRGNSIKFEGLKPIIANFAICRFVEKQQLNVTRKSIAKKKNDHSEAVTEQVLNSLSSDYRSLANSYLTELYNYLEVKKESFPVYDQNCDHLRRKIKSKIVISSGRKSSNRDGMSNDVNVIFRDERFN